MTWVLCSKVKIIYCEEKPIMFNIYIFRAYLHSWPKGNKNEKCRLREAKKNITFIFKRPSKVPKVSRQIYPYFGADQYYRAWALWLVLHMILKKIKKVMLIFRVCMNIVYYWKLKIYYWKYCSKIIFKYVNSAVRPSFKTKFTFFYTCGSLEQCTGLKKKIPKTDVGCFQYNPNSTLIGIRVIKNLLTKLWLKKKKLLLWISFIFVALLKI